MDAVVILAIAVYLCVFDKKESRQEELVMDVLVRETMLNPDFYTDDNAFMKVANNLGFY